MTHNDMMLTFMPLDLDTFPGSERFMAGTQSGEAFNQGIRAYLRASYQDAIEHFKSALIAAYVRGGLAATLHERDRAIIHLYIGNAYAFDALWSEAQREYLEAVQTDSQLAEAHYNLGVAFAAQGQLERAIAAFKSSLEHNPGLYEAHFSLGRCYQRLDNAGRAYIHYQQASAARPQAAEPRYYIGLMHQSHGAYELAQRCFTDALRVEPTFVTPELPLDTLTQRSEHEVIDWYYRLSDDLKAQGYDEEAERIYNALLQWRPNEYRARYLLGNLLARNQQLDEALVSYEHVPPHDSHYVEARIRMSAVLRLQRDITRAYHVLFTCAQQFPAHGRLFLQMGKLLYDMGRHSAAVRAFERAVQLLPRDAHAHYLLGYMYTIIGRENWAIAAWRKAVEIAPEAHSLRYDLGYMYARRGRYDLAARAFTQVLGVWPDDLETYYMLGLCYKELLAPNRAIHFFEKVLQRNPSHALALYHLGAVYLQMGNTSLGKAYLRRYDQMTGRDARGALRGRGVGRTGIPSRQVGQPS